MSTKVNFEIVEINKERGVAMVNYWADGATFERFHSDIGPYEILMLPNCDCMSDEEFHQHIAQWGLDIVKRQSDALEVENLGVTDKYEALVNNKISVEVKFAEDLIDDAENEDDSESTTES
jgi:hypothetical protein